MVKARKGPLPEQLDAPRGSGDGCLGDERAAAARRILEGSHRSVRLAALRLLVRKHLCGRRGLLALIAAFHLCVGYHWLGSAGILARSGDPALLV